MKQSVIVLLFIATVFTACSRRMPTQIEERLRVIYETDMGNDVDDALALDMIYKYVEDDKMDVLAIMSNKNSRYSAEFIDIMGTWYGYPEVPIGIVKKGVDSEQDAINYARSVCEMGIDGEPAFQRSMSDYESLPEAAILYRKILSKEPDHSVTIVSVGFSTNIARLMNTQADEFSPLTGKELIAQKVKLLCMMAGSFGEKPIVEYNIRKDISAAQQVFAEWPGSIVVTPFEVGIQINYPGSSIENDFNWGMLHPMVEAYKAYLPMPYDRPTWDLTALLYAVYPDSSFMSVSPKGLIFVDNEGFTHFSPNENGMHTYLSVNQEKVESIKDYFVRLISRKPKKIL